MLRPRDIIIVFAILACITAYIIYSLQGDASWEQARRDPGGEHIGIFLKRMKSLDAQERGEAIEYIGYAIFHDRARDSEIDYLDEVIKALRKALHDREHQVRSRAVTALGKIGPDAKEALPEIVDIFNSDRDYIRSNAAWALAAFGSEGITSLGELLETSDSRGNIFIIEALARLSGNVTESVSLLVKTLRNDPDPEVRAYAARGLGRMDPPAMSALDVLRDIALNDEDQSVRAAAGEAIGRIAR